VYHLRSASGEDKRIIIEEPVRQNTTLSAPAKYDEKTANLYRFRMELPAGGSLDFTATQEWPVSQSVTLAELDPETFASYCTNGEIPQNVHNALTKAVSLKAAEDRTVKAKTDLESAKADLVSDEDRVRKNLEAASAGSTGNASPQAQEYLKRLSDMDAQIDALNTQIRDAREKAQTAKNVYEEYLAGLTI
jgi:hypothetical protein